MASCGVYAIINKTNGHRYIGSSCDILKRWNAHQYRLRKGNHHSIYLQRAWNLYREENFKFLFLLQCDRKIRIEREQDWIDECKPEYNVSTKANAPMNVPGYKASLETCARISAGKRSAHTKRPDNIERNKTMKTKGHTGIPHSPETRAKMSVAWGERKKRGFSDETRAKMSIASTGRRHTPESRAKISASLIGHLVSAESAEKSAAKQRGRKLSPERIQLSIDCMKAAREKRRAEQS